MFEYGYLIGNDNNSKLFTPHKLDKISLKATRLKFVVVGTKDLIFNWMECNGRVTCEFEQRFHYTTPLSDKRMLSFELYDIDENRERPNGIRKYLTGKKKSTKMRLEINITSDNEPLPTPNPNLEDVDSNLIMSSKGMSGVTLHQVLDAWKSTSHSNTKSTRDYE